MHIKTHSSMQLQVTRQSLSPVRTQCPMIWVARKHSREPTQGLRDVNNPNPNIYQLSKETLLLCHELDV